MALEDIFKALEEEGERQRREILGQARAEAKRIVKEAKEEGERIEERQLKKMADSLKGELARILNEARLERKKAIITAKEATISQVFEDTKQRLAALGGSADYEAHFHALVSETLPSANSEVTVYVNPRDLELAGREFAARGLTVDLKTDETATGGLRLVADHGRVVCMNTLDSRLERARDALRTQLTAILFG